MDKMLKVLVGSLLALLFVGGFSASAQQIQPQDDDRPVRTVSVSGVGEVQAVPDQVVIQIGVETEAESAESALEDNNEKTASLLDTLENAGIPAVNIQTQRINLNPVYDFDNSDGSRTLTGYQVSNIVEVRTDDLDGVGSLLDAAVGAGANTIQGIRFEVTDTADLVADAREAAVQQAVEKAMQLADLTGASLGPVLTINESGGQPEPILRQAEFAAGEADVPIRPGTSSIRVNVQITWELEVNTLTE